MERRALASLAAVLLAATACSPPRFLREAIGRRTDSPAGEAGPPQPPPPPSAFLFGVILSSNAGGWDQVMRRAGASGALVMDVIPGTPAAGAGVERGHVIVAVDGTAVHGHERVTALFGSSTDPRHRITVAAPGEGMQVLDATLVEAGSFSMGGFVRERFLVAPDPITRFLYAQFADDAGESLRVLDGLLVELPGFAQAHALRAARLLERAVGDDGQTVPTEGQVAEIREEVTRATELDPGSLDVRLTAARILTVLGDGEAARAEAVEAVRIGRDSAEARYRLGLLLVALGQAEAGVPHLRRAVALNPYALEYYAQLARGYIALGNRPYAAATVDAGKSLVDDPEILEAFDKLLEEEQQQ